MKKLFVISCIWLMGISLFAQSTITGKVTAKDDGQPLPGVNIVVKGTATGTVTDFDGNYSLQAEAAAVLVYSFVGYVPQEVAVGNIKVINVSLASESIGLNEMVVTALGIKKNQKSLSYSAQQLKGDELTKAKDANMINSMAGKTAGVQITKSSSGVGGSAKVAIRGGRSLGGNNQPLYVIDGVPMLNSVSSQPVTTIGGTNDAGGRDSGDGISNMNPDDIESMSILKGASASALYGSAAANGVIVITTKKGRSGKAQIDVNSSTTFDRAFVLPEFQSSYGLKPGTDVSWGGKTSKTYDHVKDFFGTGVTSINSVSVSKGSEEMQTYFSYANTTANGIVDGNKLGKHNLNFRETAKLFKNKLSLDASINLVRQKVENRPTPGGYYMNPLVGLYRFPIGENIAPYRDAFEEYNPDRNFNTQNWYKAVEPMEQNPYWLNQRTPSSEIRNRVITSVSAKWDVNNWLSVQARGNADYTNDNYEQKIFASTDPSLAGENGRFITDNVQETLLYGDLLANANYKWENWGVVASLGTSINESKFQKQLLDSRPTGLNIPNVFNVGNMLGVGYVEESQVRTQLQSVFGTAQLGYKDFLFLDVTARNDWSSTLAFTDSKDKGFFYDSYGLTAVLSDMVEMPSWISFGKLRGSYARVGNGLPTAITRRQHTMGGGGNYIGNSSKAFDNLKPELSSSVEFGTDWRFFASKVNFELTYYKTNTTNQLFSIPAPAGSGFSTYWVNAGDIQNQGVEVTLGLMPVSNIDFTWKSDFNFSLNRNEVIGLHMDLAAYEYGQKGSNSYFMKLIEGGELGDIYGVTYKRKANGLIDTDDAGLPIKDDGDFKRIANANPDFRLSWNNSLSYKNFSLSVLVDGSFGGDVLSLTEADMDKYGVSKASGDARAKGYVQVGSQQFKDVEGFYSLVGGRDGISEQYVYSATNIRLRELVLAYSLPKSLVAKTGFLSSANISFVGRNLFFFMNDAPYDPDNSMSTGNNLQGVEVYGLPSTRSLGFNVKLSF
ncbi:MAG: SusC/RagA family TonB-linked outer membrane protein [Breznakibacter sp.]